MIKVETAYLGYLRGVMEGLDKALEIARKHNGDVVEVMRAADFASQKYQKEVDRQARLNAGR